MTQNQVIVALLVCECLAMRYFWLRCEKTEKALKAKNVPGTTGLKRENEKMKETTSILTVELTRIRKGHEDMKDDPKILAYFLKDCLSLDHVQVVNHQIFVRDLPEGADNDRH